MGPQKGVKDLQLCSFVDYISRKVFKRSKSATEVKGDRSAQASCSRLKAWELKCRQLSDISRRYVFLLQAVWPHVVDIFQNRIFLSRLRPTMQSIWICECYQHQSHNLRLAFGVWKSAPEDHLQHLPEPSDWHWQSQQKELSPPLASQWSQQSQQIDVPASCNKFSGSAYDSRASDRAWIASQTCMQ